MTGSEMIFYLLLGSFFVFSVSAHFFKAKVFQYGTKIIADAIGGAESDEAERLFRKAEVARNVTQLFAFMSLVGLLINLKFF